MSIQEFNQNGSKKVKENPEMSSKTRKEARRENIISNILMKFGGRLSSLNEKTDIKVTEDNFDNILTDIELSDDKIHGDELVKKAKDMIEDRKRSYDKILSDAKLSTQDRDEIKKERNKVIAEMREELDRVLNVKLVNEKESEEIIENEPVVFTEPKLDSKKEEGVFMNFENKGSEGLMNMQTYEDYMFGEILKRKNTLSEADFDNFIKLVIDYFVKGSKIIGVLTLEEFIDERRRELEKVEQRKIEEARRQLESDLINSDSNLKESRERVDMLEKQTGEYKKQLGDLRKENNTLEQKVSQQGNTISELTEANGNLGNQIEMDKRSISEQQKQIFELQRRLDGEVAAREQDGKRIQTLEAELGESRKRESDAEARIEQLNESTKKWRDNLSKELKKLSPSDDTDNEMIANRNQGDIDLQKLRESFDDLTRAMNGEETFEAPEMQGIQIR